MRYEVRLYSLEDRFLPEGGMTYTPCHDREDAKRVYAEFLSDYSDNLHEVELVRVNYTAYGESVSVIASTRNANPRKIEWDVEYLETEEDESGYCESDDSITSEDEIYGRAY